MPKNPRWLTEWLGFRLDRDFLLALFAIECALDLRADNGWSLWSVYAANGEWA